MKRLCEGLCSCPGSGLQANLQNGNQGLMMGAFKTVVCIDKDLKDQNSLLIKVLAVTDSQINECCVPSTEPLYLSTTRLIVSHHSKMEK